MGERKKSKPCLNRYTSNEKNQKKQCQVTSVFLNSNFNRAQREKKMHLWYCNDDKMPSKVKDLQNGLSPTWKLSTLFWFECHLSEKGLRLMSEVDKSVHQRHINDLCVKRSMTLSSSHIHLNLARGGVGGNRLLTSCRVGSQRVLEELDSICHALGPPLLILL